MLLSVCTLAHQVNAFPEVGGAVMLWVIHVCVCEYERIAMAGLWWKQNRRWGRCVLDRDIQEGPGT